MRQGALGRGVAPRLYAFGPEVTSVETESLEFLWRVLVFCGSFTGVDGEISSVGFVSRLRLGRLHATSTPCRLSDRGTETVNNRCTEVYSGN